MGVQNGGVPFCGHHVVELDEDGRNSGNDVGDSVPCAGQLFDGGPVTLAWRWRVSTTAAKWRASTVSVSFSVPDVVRLRGRPSWLERNRTSALARTLDATPGFMVSWNSPNASLTL
jgi:hypothetical protein